MFNALSIQCCIISINTHVLCPTSHGCEVSCGCPFLLLRQLSQHANCMFDDWISSLFASASRVILKRDTDELHRHCMVQCVHAELCKTPFKLQISRYLCSARHMAVLCCSFVFTRAIDGMFWVGFPRDFLLALISADGRGQELKDRLLTVTTCSTWRKRLAKTTCRKPFWVILIADIRSRRFNVYWISWSRMSAEVTQLRIISAPWRCMGDVGEYFFLILNSEWNVYSPSRCGHYTLRQEEHGIHEARFRFRNEIAIMCSVARSPNIVCATR
jgi:hypothetical protein